MNVFVSPSSLQGTIRTPSSKSMMQRAVAAALLASGKTVIRQPSFCNDALSALDIAKNMGAVITDEDNKCIILSDGIQPVNPILDCGEAGLSIRMFTPIACLHDKTLILKASGSLKNRPVSMMEKPLRQLGAECKTNHGLPPVTVKGPLKGGKADVDSSMSSQFLTGLLMALPTLKNDTMLLVHGLTSKPYIDMTLQLLEDFGIGIENQDYERFFIRGNQLYIPREYKVDGDWSAASFLLCAGALSGSITVTGLDLHSPQADKSVIHALTAAGAKIVTGQDAVTVTKDRLNAFHFDASGCPDLFPPLVALAVHCDGTTALKGANRLTHKESNRATVLQNEFSSLGADIQINDDLIIIQGTTLQGGKVNSHNDHRIAMAAAISALSSVNGIIIEGTECVSKSYPAFFHDIEKAGMKIKKINP